MTRPSIDKKHVAHVLEEISVLLELQGENRFRVIAYQNASRAIDALPDDLDRRVAQGTLTDIKGIGEAIAEKIAEFVTTGRLAYYDDLKRQIAPGLLEMMRIQGLGPKRVKLLHDTLRITTIQQLKTACEQGRIGTLAGFGEKTQDNILKGIAEHAQHQEQRLYPEALEAAEDVMRALKRERSVQHIALCGSLRRRREVIGDIDILVASAQPTTVMKRVTSLPRVHRVLAHGETKSSVLLDHDPSIQCDVRVVTVREFPFALHYFTGSKEHNTSIRVRAKKMRMKLSEYGLFKGKQERMVPCQDETALFRHLGLRYIPPELREDMGEIQAAEQGTLPHLITERDLRGVFHTHTTYSDGAHTVEQMVTAALTAGNAYMGLSDHSQSARYAHGMQPDDVKRQQAEIDIVAKKYPKIRLFKGSEVDILADGSLDYPERILKTFDFVIAAVHSHFTMSESAMTRRVITALRHPRVTFLAHPTGRLLLAREPYAVDVDAVLRAAAKHGVIIEINANPHRLDLDWRMMQHAKQLGVRFSINPDAHRTEGLQDVMYGVGIARKGWLEPRDVFNTMTAPQVAAYLRQRHG